MTSGGPATFHASFLETTAAGPSARVRPMVKGGGGGKAGDHSVDSREGVTSGGPATFHASFLETTAAGPSARVSPMVKGGGSGKAGDHGVDAREGVTSGGPATFHALSRYFATACGRAGPRGSWTRKRERERRERERQIVYINIYKDLYKAARRLLGRA